MSQTISQPSISLRTYSFLPSIRANYHYNITIWTFTLSVTDTKWTWTQALAQATAQEGPPWYFSFKNEQYWCCSVALLPGVRLGLQFGRVKKIGLLKSSWVLSISMRGDVIIQNHGKSN